MSLVIVETLSDSPLTPDEPTETDYKILSCIAERNGRWRYSLLSRDRDRMICTFEAPDAESVRESYRKSGGFYSRVWTGDLLKPKDASPQLNPSILKVFEATHPDGFSQSELHKINQSVLSSCTEKDQDVEWVQSYLSLDGKRLICEINAPDTELIREAYDKCGITCDRIWSAMLIQA